MTDPTPRPDDELVSAVLDGEATADERARVEADPAARARLAELAAVRDRIAAPVTVPDDARERAIAAALAAFDAPAIDEPAGGGAPAFRTPDPGRRDDLAARRAKRSGSGARYLAAAAAVVVVLLGAGAVIRATNQADQQTAATSADQEPAAPTSTRAGVTDQSDAGEVGSANPAPQTTTMPPMNSAVPTTTAPAAEEQPTYPAILDIDLGSVASVRELRTRMLEVVDERAAVVDGTVDPPLPPLLASDRAYECASYLDAVDPELDELLAVGTAVLQGEVTSVYAFSIDQAAYPAANGSIRIYAVVPDSCATVSVLTTR